MGETSWWTPRLLGEELHESGKSIAQRSEGGLGLMGESKLVDTAAAGRELHELGKGIAQRSRRGLL